MNSCIVIYNLNSRKKRETFLRCELKKEKNVNALQMCAHSLLTRDIASN